MSYAWEVDVLGSPMFQLCPKLKCCKHELVKWKQSRSSNSKEQINKLKERLANLKEGRQATNLEDIAKLEEDLTKAYEQEERFWREKSRVNWLRCGDQNTKYFHARFHARNR